MGWGVLIDPRPTAWRPFAQVTGVHPAQDAWFDPARLLDPQPRARLRLRCDAAGEAWLALDLGAPAELLTHAALVSTTIAGGTLRLAGSATDPTAAAAEAFDTGVLPADGLAEPVSGTIALALAPAGPAQYLRLALTAAPLAWIDIGLIVAGAAWVPQRQWQYGAQVGRLDLSAEDQNPASGATFARPGPTPRVWEFDVPHGRAELIGPDAINGGETLLDRLDRLAAARRDVLAIPDLGDAPGRMSRRAIWGRLVAPPSTLARFDVVRRRWRIVERL